MMRLLVMVAMMVLVAGCATAVSSGYGQGGRDASGRSYEEARADNLIRSAVTSALVKDPLVPAMHIEVEAMDGVVTLRGRVPSPVIARRAGQLAAAVKSVKRVDNQLRVAP